VRDALKVESPAKRREKEKGREEPCEKTAAPSLAGLVGGKFFAGGRWIFRKPPEIFIRLKSSSHSLLSSHFLTFSASYAHPPYYTRGLLCCRICGRAFPYSRKPRGARCEMLAENPVIFLIRKTRVSGILRNVISSTDRASYRISRRARLSPFGTRIRAAGAPRLGITRAA